MKAGGEALRGMCARGPTERVPSMSPVTVVPGPQKVRTMQIPRPRCGVLQPHDGSLTITLHVDLADHGPTGESWTRCVDWGCSGDLHTLHSNHVDNTRNGQEICVKCRSLFFIIWRKSLIFFFKAYIECRKWKMAPHWPWQEAPTTPRAGLPVPPRPVRPVIGT